MRFFTQISEKTTSVFKEMNNYYSLYFKKGSSNLLALDIGSSSIKIFELRKKQRVLTLIKHKAISLEDDWIAGHRIRNYDALVDTLAKFVIDNGYEGYDTAVVVAGPQVVTQILKLPTRFAHYQLKTYIELEAEKYLPFRIEELAFDYKILNNKQKNQDTQEVLLAAAKKEYINEYIDLIKTVNLNPKVVDVYGCVVNRLCQQINEPTEDKVVAMIDIGASVITLSIYKDEHQLYLREFNYGGRELNKMMMLEYSINETQAEEMKLNVSNCTVDAVRNKFKDILIGQIYQLIHFFYVSVFADKIDCVYMFGGTAQLPGLAIELENKLKLPVKIFNPFIETTVGIHCANNQLPSTQFTLVYGLSLRNNFV